MVAAQHVLLNAIANTGAGAFNVACQLARHMGPLRPQDRFTLALIDRWPLHDEVQPQTLPVNCQVLRAPAETIRRLPRVRWERSRWPRFVREQGVTSMVQFNGMVVPGVDVATLAHQQDPWPYLPEAWEKGFRERVLAFLRRREHARAFRQADVNGFTSHYLRRLMTEHLGLEPRRSEVFYNGLPPEWIARARDRLPPLDDREPELISVSSVGVYKRQELVIRALPLLIVRPGCERLRYRILGHAYNDFDQHLLRVARELGVEDRVRIEGRVSDEVVQQGLRRARVFVLMSVCESFGIPAIEAMSFGTPVVTSDCCAMPEVCGNGSAILSPVDDVAHLADNLYRVWSDRELAEDLRRRAAANIERFNWNDTATRMLDALDRATDDRRRAAAS